MENWSGETGVEAEDQRGSYRPSPGERPILFEYGQKGNKQTHRVFKVELAEHFDTLDVERGGTVRSQEWHLDSWVSQIEWSTPTFICWSSILKYLWMQPYLETKSLQKWLS